MIEIQELSKDFAHDEIIKELNLEIFPGESLGLWGAPKSGLTTLLRLMSGYLIPTTGRVLIDERNVAIDKDYVSKVISYVPHKLTFPPAMRVQEILAFAARIRGLGPAEKVAQQLCEKLQLQDCWNLRLGHLPESLQRLVSLAQALIHEPKILLIDEPLHPRDSWQKQRLHNWFAELKPFAIRVISSHFLEDLIPICTRIAVFQEGHLARILTPDQLKTPEQLLKAMQKDLEEAPP